jgi:hypothetical protein
MRVFAAGTRCGARLHLVIERAREPKVMGIGLLGDALEPPERPSLALLIVGGVMACGNSPD